MKIDEFIPEDVPKHCPECGANFGNFDYVPKALADGWDGYEKVYGAKGDKTNWGKVRPLHIMLKVKPL